MLNASCLSQLIVYLQSTHRICFGGVYTYPLNRLPTYLLPSFNDNVEEVYSSCGSDTRIIIAGDFNQPCMDWTFPSPVPINMACGYKLYLMNYLNFINSTLSSIYMCGVLLVLVLASDESLLGVATASDPLLC